jgi:uncharacterized protein YecT (DUF1311 family)
VRAAKRRLAYFGRLRPTGGSLPPKISTLKNSGDGSIARSCYAGRADTWRWVVKRAPTDVRRRTYAVAAAMTVCVLMLSCRSARSGEKDSHEMTALGVISENVREIYAREVEACYDEAGKVARGPQFLNCLQRQARSQQDMLEAVYDARMSYLRSNAPELAASLQSAQEAWLHFREANCGFVRSSARANNADEAFQNCVLRTTIYRRINLRWLIGD